jgi:hypothetical protein
VGRLLSTEKETLYQRHTHTPGDGAVTPGTDCEITTCRSSQKEMNRLDYSSFPRLDRVILRLSKQPAPRGSLKLKWLLAQLSIIRGVHCVVVYATDLAGKRVRLLKVTDWGREGFETGVDGIKTGASPANPRPRWGETSRDGSAFSDRSELAGWVLRGNREGVTLV